MTPRIIKSQSIGVFTMVDAKANLMGRTSRPITPFDRIEVELARDYPEEGLSKGERVILNGNPNGFLYLLKGLVGCFETDAEEGKDFNFV